MPQQHCRRVTNAGIPQPLGECALWGEFDLDLTAQVMARELLVLTYATLNDATVATLRQQLAETPAIDTAAVRYDLEVVDPLAEQRPDEHVAIGQQPTGRLSSRADHTVSSSALLGVRPAHDWKTLQNDRGSSYPRRKAISWVLMAW